MTNQEIQNIYLRAIDNNDFSNLAISQNDLLNDFMLMSTREQMHNGQAKFKNINTRDYIILAI